MIAASSPAGGRAEVAKPRRTSTAACARAQLVLLTMQGRDHHASNVGREALRPPAHSLTIGVATQPMEIAMPWTEAEGALIQDMASEALQVLCGHPQWPSPQMFGAARIMFAHDGQKQAPSRLITRGARA
jgi:hypothetical protein